MFWGRRNKASRQEPRFGFTGSLSGLRVTRDDRVAAADDERKAPAMSKRNADDDDGDEKPKTRAKAPAKSRRKGKKSRHGRGFFGNMIYWSAVLGLWSVIGVIGLIVWVGAHLPAIQSLEVPKRPPTIQIAGIDGSILITRGEMAGTNIALKDLPAHLPKAFIAVEDRRFYSHMGVDPMGIVRAAAANVMHRGVSQGGSTLTQQLAKNIFLTQERTMMRKLQEVELALWLEHKYSKTEILELYLNRVYFGSGAYGVEAASQKYFGKPARSVTLAEAALLAGLVKSPSRLAPNRNPEGAERRAQTVLGAMADAGFITEAQAKATIGNPAYAVKPAGAGTINYVADWIVDVLDDLVGQVDQNIIVETSIDPKLQSLAEAAIIDELAAKSVKFNVSQGALVAMTPQGEVRAMVGGRNYAESQFNRAVTAKRQPGSAFKPFVYLAALESGLTPDSTVYDLPVTIDHWSPRNDNGLHRGAVTMRQALAQSINSVAVRLQYDVGVKRVVAVAQRLGVKSELRRGPSLALGTSEVSLLEMTGGYTAFANGGRRVEPHIIKRVRISSGRVLYMRPPSPTEISIAPVHVGGMNDMLNSAMVQGTGRRAGLLLHPAAGKTGTTQEFRDAWFIGYTAHLAAGVWVGNDQGRTMNNVRGGSLPAAIWHQIMTTAHENRAVVALPGTASPAEQREREPFAQAPVAPSVTSKQQDYYRPLAPRAAAPLLPSHRIDGDFVARALADAPSQPEVEARRDLAMPRFAPTGMMSLGRQPN